MHQRFADYRVFWRQFRQAYTSTGAVLPSGRNLCAALSSFVRNPQSACLERGVGTGRRRILEVGPGTGAVTKQIIRDMRPDDYLVLVELNDEFVDYLRDRLPELAGSDDVQSRISIVHAAVEDLPDEEPFDLIISGLPLNNFSAELVDRILSKFSKLLAQGGTISFFEYVAVRRAKAIVSASTDRERLQGIQDVLATFLKAEVRRDMVLANVPPAWVHHVRPNRQAVGTKT